MQTHERIKERRLALGLTLQQLGNKLGVHHTTISRYETQYIEKLPTSKLIPLAEVLETTPEYLLGVTDNLSLKNYNTPNYNKYSKPAPLKKVKSPYHTAPHSQIPLFTGGIACGEPIPALDEHEMITKPGNILADFAIYCKGDSMIGANITDGSVVYIRKQPRVDNGQIAAVLIGEDATLKKVYLSKGKLTLMPANPNYPPMVYTGEELDQVTILGLAVGFTTYLH